MAREIVDQRVVVTVCDVVVVLHAYDLGDALRFGYLSRRGVAHPDVANQALALEIGQRRDLLGDRSLGNAVAAAHHPVVRDVQRVEPQVAEVVVDARGQLFGRDGRLPRLVGRPTPAELGDDDQPGRVRVQRLADDLVGDVRTVIVGSVDVVDARRDGLA